MLDQLAAKVKFLRSSAGLSLQQVATLAGCTKSHIWEIEQGKSANPTLRTIVGLCRAFGVSIADFVTGLELATITAERDMLRKALNTLSTELTPWLTGVGGLPAVIKTIGDCTDLHTAQRKARAVLAKAGEGDGPAF